MSIFGNILEKLGFKKEKPKPAAKPAAAATKPNPAASALRPAPTGQQAGATKPKPQAEMPKPKPQAGAQVKPGTMAPGSMPPSAQAAAVVKPAAVPMVDVVSKLEGLAKANPQKLNWKTSIVDLLKLLDIDSSLDARKELATELHCPADKMDSSAEMNTWLHKTVLQKIAENGGNVPKELLD